MPQVAATHWSSLSRRIQSTLLWCLSFQRTGRYGRRWPFFPVPYTIGALGIQGNFRGFMIICLLNLMSCVTPLQEWTRRYSRNVWPSSSRTYLSSAESIDIFCLRWMVFAVNVTHTSLNSLLERNILCVALPVHTSHRTQVLEYTLFS